MQNYWWVFPENGGSQFKNFDLVSLEASVSAHFGHYFNIWNEQIFKKVDFVRICVA